MMPGQQVRNAPCSGAICIPDDRAELAGLVDQRELHRVGRRPVPDEIRGELGREQERLGCNGRVGHRGKIIHARCRTAEESGAAPDTRVRKRLRSANGTITAAGGAVDAPDEATGATRQRRVARRGRARRGGGPPGGPGPGQRAGHLPRRHAARRRVGAGRASTEAFAKGGKLMFVVLGLLVSFDQLTLNAVQLLGPELRAHVPHQQGHGRVHRHRVGPVLRARRGPAGLARRPHEARARSSASRACSARRSRSLTGAAVNAFMLFWMHLLHRHHQGQRHRGAPVADRRQLPDRHPRPDVGGA